MNNLLAKLTFDGPPPDLSEALCCDPDLDPETWQVDDAVMQRVAKGYCFLCPVKQGCYDRAIVEEINSGYQAFGIRGGKDASDRQRVLDFLRLRKELGLEDD